MSYRTTIFGLVVLGGCGTPAPDATAREQPALDIVVEDSGTAQRAELLFALSGPAAVFGSVGDATLIGRRIAVLDRLSAKVTVFSLDGDQVEQVGRQGEGPGEFSGLGTLAVLRFSDSTLLVPDIRNQSVTEFLLDGAVVQSRQLDFSGSVPAEWKELRTGRVAVRHSRSDRTSAVISQDFAEAFDTLAVLPALPVESDEGKSPVLPARWVWTVADDGGSWAAASTHGNRIDWRRGNDRLGVFVGNEDASLQRDDEEAILAIVAERMSGGQYTAAAGAELRSRISLPSSAPIVANLALANNGELLLVQRVRPFAEMDMRILAVLAAEGLGGPLWDLFEWSSRRYCGTVDFGSNGAIMDVSGDTAVVLREDSLGVQTIALARIPGCS